MWRVFLPLPLPNSHTVSGNGTKVAICSAAFRRIRSSARVTPYSGIILITSKSAEPTASSILGVALGVGALLLLVNWIYDALALRHGVLEDYNQPWADGAGPWAIAADYACWFFGVFGLLYGAGLRFAEGALLAAPSWGEVLAIGAGLVIATAVLPTLGYICSSYLRHGHSGCRPIARGADA